MRNKIVAAITAAALAGVGIAATGAVFSAEEARAQETIESPTSSPLTGVLNGLVEDGVLTDEQATAVRQALDEARASLAERGWRPGHHRGFAGLRDAMTAAGDILGMEESELRSALVDGSTLSDLAEEQGVESQEIVDAMVAQVQSHIDQAVEDGKLDEDRAAELEAGAAERIERLVEEGPSWRNGGGDPTEGAADTQADTAGA